MNLTDLGHNQKTFPFRLGGGGGLHPGMLRGTKLRALGYLAVGASPGAPRQGWAERGHHLFA